MAEIPAETDSPVPGGWPAAARVARRAALALTPACVALLAGAQSARAEAALGSAQAVYHVDGGALSLAWVIPFAGLLLSIATLPMVAPKLWHRHFGKVAALWALGFLVPFAAVFGLKPALYETIHTGLLEYLPFVVLLFALYTVSSGVRLAGTLRATPAMNTAILAIGAGLANVMGTTGASMLLIRPLLQANAGRRHNVHVVVFFIFLVANIGGSLTPLGDPPLFLGFLKGVDFFWTARHMALPALFTGAAVLGAFFVLDRRFFMREGGVPERAAAQPIRLEGGINLFLLVAIMAAVLMSGMWRPDAGFTVYHVHVELQNAVRDALLVGIGVTSLALTRPEVRRAQEFTWFPMMEVTKLFAAIFLTIVPVIAILRAGEGGALAFLVRALSADGRPVNALYFWTTGALSSFLDNAPTYLVFFNSAGGDPERLMGPLGETLLAISAGAVFMGAMTYIGNAPNFMVRSIAQERGIAMPSFFGYMLWSVGILVPVFALMTLVFFR